MQIKTTRLTISGLHWNEENEAPFVDFRKKTEEKLNQFLISKKHKVVLILSNERGFPGTISFLASNEKSSKINIWNLKETKEILFNSLEDLGIPFKKVEYISILSFQIMDSEMRAKKSLEKIEIVQV